MTTMKSAEEFKQEALQAIKDLGGFPYNPDIYWSYRAVKDIPVWKEQYFHSARGDGKSMQWMEERAYENIKNTFGEEVAKEAKRYCEELKVEMVEGTPTVDAVQVIRCKECKYLFKVKNGIFVTYGCERDWCCYTERKEE